MRASRRATRPSTRDRSLAFLGTFSLIVADAVADDRPAPPPALPEIVVVGVLPGTGLSLEEFPANVQILDGRALDRGGGGLASGLNWLAGSVAVNDTQGNPFQPDITFRGFTASPVLGTPQGVSVFVDGVRVNEAFADAVNWDLIPAIAIANVVVVPGSDPVFGLNTLGGALNVSTKRGFAYPGAAAEGSLGSFGRRALDAEAGGHGERFDYYVAGSLVHDDGWADHNPSSVRQLFGKAGYRDAVDDVTLSLTYADNELEGGQTLPLSFLTNPQQSYTWPDRQSNRMTFLDLDATRELSDGWTLAAQAFWRDVDTALVNSNVNNDYDPSQPPGPGNQPTGNALESLGERQAGGALQLMSRRRLAAHPNTFIAGATYDRGRTEFHQSGQEAGSSRDTRSTEPATLVTALHAVNEYASVYATDRLALGERVHVSVAGRYDSANVSLDDQLGTALDGRHSFGRFNPAIGLTFNPAPRLTLYASFGEGMRVPTPVELTCADPGAPCTLPNAFAADPPLRPVIARTAELGARGGEAARLSWSAALFRTRLDDDIQFVSSGGGAVNAGFFRNVGETRRAGVEVGVDGRAGALSLSGRYTYLEATYETPLTLSSPNNSTAAPLSCPQCAEIQVAPGDHVPGLPRHNLKLRAEYARARWVVGAGLTAQSDQFARGDENNHDRNGAVPGFAVVELDLRYQVARRWHLVARLDNLLDRRYSTFGVLGRNVFTGAGDTFDPTGSSWRPEQFRSVAAPRGVWIGFAVRSAADDDVP